MAKGGTEPAPMSTSAKKDVALAYAESKCGLLFQYKTRGLGRGVDITFLSVRMHLRHPEIRTHTTWPFRCHHRPRVYVVAESAGGVRRLVFAVVPERGGVPLPAHDLLAARQGD